MRVAAEIWTAGALAGSGVSYRPNGVFFATPYAGEGAGGPYFTP